MSFLFGAACIFAIIFMVTFMFIGIWLFIVALKAFRQLRYKNYILEKIYQKLAILADKDSNISNLATSDSTNFFDLDTEDSLTNFDNVKDFDKIEKSNKK